MCAVVAVLVNRMKGVLVDPPFFRRCTRRTYVFENRLPPRDGVVFFVTFPETVRASPRPELTNENRFRRNITR